MVHGVRVSNLIPLLLIIHMRFVDRPPIQNHNWLPPICMLLIGISFYIFIDPATLN